MRTAIFLSVLAGLVAASPVPQDIDFDGVSNSITPTSDGPPVDAVSGAVTYNAASAATSAAVAASTDPASAKVKRTPGVNDACGVQPDGYGLQTHNPDTPAAFTANLAYEVIALIAPTPQGYSLSFQNLKGSSQMSTYLGLYTLETYDTIQCQQYCDAATACYGINIYIERDPSVNPAVGCDNPPSITNYKCTLWGSAVTAASATNTGQWRENFEVVIAGSNGYSKQGPPPSQPNFDGPTELGGAINAPSGYIGMKFYSGPYNPAQCAAACTATTAYDHRHATNGSYDACNFFNSYVLSIDNIPQGTYCSMYTQPWDKSYSTNYGQYRGFVYYSVSQSYAYTLDPQDPGVVSSKEKI